MSAVETGRFGMTRRRSRRARRFRALAFLDRRRTRRLPPRRRAGRSDERPEPALQRLHAARAVRRLVGIHESAARSAPAHPAPRLGRHALARRLARLVRLLLRRGSTIPEPPGPWDGPLVLARLLVIAAIVVAMRTLISFRIAILDAWVMCAATIALGAAFVWHGLADGVSAASLFTLNRPLLGIVTLILLVSAALGSWQGLPRSRSSSWASERWR